MQVPLIAYLLSISQVSKSSALSCQSSVDAFYLVDPSVSSTDISLSLLGSWVTLVSFQSSL
jgi:hypothetical protein